MKHSTTELVGLVHRFYPRDLWSSEPQYNDTEEYRRMLEAVRGARADYARWKSMLGRLEARFPGCVRDMSLHIFGDAFESAYCGKLCLPKLDPDEDEHELGFRVSFMAPYYVIYTLRWRHLENDPGGNIASPAEVRFEFSPVAQPYERGLAQEIEATYGYEAMPPEIGTLVVPDVTTSVRAFGTATIYDCLLSDDWKR
jgi:hypothetical protein